MNLLAAADFLAKLKPTPESEKIDVPIQDRYEFQDLIDCACGKWRNIAPLPAPPMLMLDTVTQLSSTGASSEKDSLWLR